MNSEFLERFQTVWARKRRVRIGQVAAATLLLAVIGFGSLVLIDYLFEWRHALRAIGLTVVSIGVILFGAKSLWRTMHSWSQPATAAEIERTFPTLGQAVRTTVQFSGLRAEQVQSAGVAATLVAALTDHTTTQTRPLSLEAVVPSKKLWVIAAGTAIAALLLAGAAGVDWEWRTASSRAALSDQPYRSLLVKPGNLLVDEGNSAQIAVALVGRTNREVAFYTRPAGQVDAEWTERILEPVEKAEAEAQGTVDHGSRPGPAIHTSRPRAEFSTQLNRLTKPLEYRVIAGELESDVYRIDIRSPLKIQQVKVDLTPPSYTGQPTDTVLDANLSVLQGTRARFSVTFDKPVKSAALVFAARKSSVDQDEPPQPEVFPLAPLAPSAPTAGTSSVSSAATAAGSANSAGTADRSSNGSIGETEITLNEDRVYSIVAEANDGTQLVENKFRVRVREDQPPQVFFESPDDSIEVHTLAELPMRIRVRDDYGLTKAGVIFQVNNEQEIPLIAEDFATVVQAAQEVAQTGHVSPATQTALEKVLPLEHFELTQKDSVMYFGYAEDNLPNRPQRTETDMRFIDIRPFKREFRLIDPDPMPGMGMGVAFKSLEELIQRQRFALNRTIQFEKRASVGQKPDANSLDQLMKFETDLAQFVRETAQGLESRGFDDTELFYQAEAAMLQAVDSLSVGKWNNATLQMRDALKFLIEQRDRTIRAILKNPDPARLAALRSFDRQQAQKIRRPKSDKEEARELIQRLEGLISQETEVASAFEETPPMPDTPATEKPGAEQPQPATQESEVSSEASQGGRQDKSP